MSLSKKIDWVSWSFILNILEQKKIHLAVWGKSEDWLPKVLRKHRPKLIIDSNRSLDSSKYEDILITHPSKISQEDWQNYYIVICSSAYREIRGELQKHGLLENKNFSVLPDLKDIQLVEDVANFSCDFLVTSSDHSDPTSQRGSLSGGGVYQCNLSSDGFFFDKKISGQYREIKKYQDNFYAVDGFSNKLTVFDKSFNIIEELDIKHSNCCGLEFVNNYLFIANSSRDSIIVLDNNLDRVDEFFISDLAGESGNSKHHINDLSSINSQLIVTMFSRSGFWRNGVFDGQLVSLDENLKIDQTLFTGLLQPHTPRVFDGEVALADSFSGRVIHGSKGEVFQADGFIRGIEKIGPTWMLGQSQTLYLERRVGASGKVFLTTGIYIFNHISKVYAFHPMPGIKNIHSLIVF